LEESVYEIKKTFFLTVKPQSELVSFLTDLARTSGITHASFSAIGQMDHVRLSFFNRTKCQHIEMANLVETQELISCDGIVTVQDGQPVAHAHVVLVDEDGATRGGHLLEGNVLFVQVSLHQLAPGDNQADPLLSSKCHEAMKIFELMKTSRSSRKYWSTPRSNLNAKRRSGLLDKL
jgi:uncharacterized protein